MLCRHMVYFTYVTCGERHIIYAKNEQQSIYFSDLLHMADSRKHEVPAIKINPSHTQYFEFV
jgi:hypothetical protein